MRLRARGRRKSDARSVKRARIASGLLCAAALLPGAAPALAQVQASFSAAVVSDYRYRGVSLSAQRPAVQAFLNLDHASGAYAGASLARVRLRYPSTGLQATAYAGFARRLGAGASVDAGISATAFGGAERYNYRELYGGLGVERASARISVSPHYFGVGGRTVYAEMNGSFALSDALDLVGHAGYLRALGQAEPGYYPTPSRADLRIALSLAHGDWTVQLAWDATRERVKLYPGALESSARRFVLSSARAF